MLKMMACWCQNWNPIEFQSVHFLKFKIWIKKASVAEETYRNLISSTYIIDDAQTLYQTHKKWQLFTKC